MADCPVFDCQYYPEEGYDCKLDVCKKDIRPFLRLIGFEEPRYFMFILTKAKETAQIYGLPWDKIRSEAMAAGVKEGHAVLKKYFEIV